MINKRVSLYCGLKCADPESFVRGGPTLNNFDNVLFLVDEGREDPNTTHSSIGAGLAFLTSLPIQDGGPTTSDPRWRSPRREIQDGGPTKSDTRWRSL